MYLLFLLLEIVYVLVGSARCLILEAFSIFLSVRLERKQHLHVYLFLYFLSSVQLETSQCLAQQSQLLVHSHVRRHSRRQLAR